MPQLFGQKLTFLRQQHGLSQTALARRLGIAKQAHLSNLEAGRRQPSIEFVLRAAHLFQVTVDYLLWDSIPVETVAVPRSIPSDDGQPLQHFGEKLRRMRLERGWTQADLADQLASVSQAYLSLLEAGQREPSLELVLQIAALFNISLHEFLFGDSADNQHEEPHSTGER